MPHPPPESVDLPLVSEFADDPEMTELIGLFLLELPTRLDNLASLWRKKDLKELQRITHQLKGASAGYGFPTIGLAASKVELRLRSCNPDDATRKLSDINTDINALVDLCQRALRGRAAT